MTNLVVNPGAESSLVTGWSGATGQSSTGWRKTTFNNALVHNGTYAFYTACSNNCLPMGQNISFTPGINYKLSLYVYQVDAGQGAFSLKIDQSTLISDTTSIYSYVQYSAIFQRSISEGYLEIRGVTENFLAIDDISITETTETNIPSATPSGVPSSYPSSAPSATPSLSPSSYPSSIPSATPSGVPSSYPSFAPSATPSLSPSSYPSSIPSATPSLSPSSYPSSIPSATPSLSPSSYPSSIPSATPSLSPSSYPSSIPSATPSGVPSSYPSSIPSATPSGVPSSYPSSAPSATPSLSPSSYPSSIPSATPSGVPSSYPSSIPSATPSGVPSSYPSSIPSATPSGVPSSYPSSAPSATPSLSPSSYPSSIPSATPSGVPSSYPSSIPSATPSASPSSEPSSIPSATPSGVPSSYPSSIPSATPSGVPSSYPSSIPSATPSGVPSSYPSSIPSATPSGVPSSYPSSAPSATPSLSPSSYPSSIPSATPSGVPSSYPSSIPSATPSASPSSEPSSIPSATPSGVPSSYPSSIPSATPSGVPSSYPSSAPSATPSASPSSYPSSIPSATPSLSPSSYPSSAPSATPSASPSSYPSSIPSATPSLSPSSYPSSAPSATPSGVPSSYPSSAPSATPSGVPSSYPSSAPSATPSLSPSSYPSSAPSATPSGVPSSYPSSAPSATPIASPSSYPSSIPSATPSGVPSSYPSSAPSATPSASPSSYPSSIPSATPSASPSSYPSSIPSATPSGVPSSYPSSAPSATPSASPSSYPSSIPSATPSGVPSSYPSSAPSATPSLSPSSYPSSAPSATPSGVPSSYPSSAPSATPSGVPSSYPSFAPSATPSLSPSSYPSSAPSATPSASPSSYPSSAPSATPSASPSSYPSSIPSATPSGVPSSYPSSAPSATPSGVPSGQPSSQPTFEPKPTIAPTLSPTDAVEEISLDSFGAHGSVIYGSIEGARIGRDIIRIGDVNGDGLGDILILTSWQKPYVVYGNVKKGNSFELGSPDYSQGFCLQTTQSYYSISAAWTGDIDEDGIDDFMVSMRYFDQQKGVIRVIYGKRNRSEDIDLDNSSDEFIFSVMGAENNDWLGSDIIGIEDSNGNTHNDILTSSATKSYVISGQGKDSSDITMPQGVSITGPISAGYPYNSFSSLGDVNGDNYSDYAIGIYNSLSFKDEIYVLNGSNSSSNIDLNTIDPLITLEKGDRVSDDFKNIGDINGDGINDFSLATLAKTYIIYGKSGGLANLSSSDGFNIYSSNNPNFNTYYVAGGFDVNKDGRSDIIVSFYYPNGNKIAAIIYGNDQQIRSNIDIDHLSVEQGLYITSNNPENGNKVVRNIGDFDGDGFKDVSISGIYTDYNQVENVGAVYLITDIFGSSTNYPTSAPNASPKPTNIPSVVPTEIPTEIPSSAPTLIPSTSGPTTGFPSGVPSSTPSGVPTFTYRPTCPTVEPTEKPSQIPTTKLTPDPSADPSAPPSFVPTISPTSNPTSIPSFIPSFRPNNSPTSAPTYVPSIFPTQNPTFAPTDISNNPYIDIVMKTSGVYNGTIANENYIMDAEGIVLLNAGGGHDKFTIMPHPNAYYTIANFDNDYELIDLTAFKNIRYMSDLSITSGSIIINLDNEQKIRLLDLNPGEVDDNNFLFYKEKGNENNVDYTFVYSIVGVISAIFLYEVSDRSKKGKWPFQSNKVQPDQLKGNLLEIKGLKGNYPEIIEKYCSACKVITETPELINDEVLNVVVLQLGHPGSDVRDSSFEVLKTVVQKRFDLINDDIISNLKLYENRGFDDAMEFANEIMTEILIRKNIVKDLTDKNIKYINNHLDSIYEAHPRFVRALYDRLDLKDITSNLLGEKITNLEKAFIDQAFQLIQPCDSSDEDGSFDIENQISNTITNLEKAFIDQAFQLIQPCDSSSEGGSFDIESDDIRSPQGTIVYRMSFVEPYNPLMHSGLLGKIAAEYKKIEYDGKIDSKISDYIDLVQDPEVREQFTDLLNEKGEQSIVDLLFKQFEVPKISSANQQMVVGTNDIFLQNEQMITYGSKKDGEYSDYRYDTNYLVPGLFAFRGTIEYASTIKYIFNEILHLDYFLPESIKNIEFPKFTKTNDFWVILHYTSGSLGMHLMKVSDIELIDIAMPMISTGIYAVHLSANDYMMNQRQLYIQEVGETSINNPIDFFNQCGSVMISKMVLDYTSITANPMLQGPVLTMAVQGASIGVVAEGLQCYNAHQEPVELTYIEASIPFIASAVVFSLAISSASLKYDTPLSTVNTFSNLLLIAGKVSITHGMSSLAIPMLRDVISNVKETMDSGIECTTQTIGSIYDYFSEDSDL